MADTRADKKKQSQKTPEAVKSRILIVDDHPIVCHGLAQLVNAEPELEICGEAASAEQALDMVLRLKPDLAIVDITLDGVNGIELIKNIRAATTAGATSSPRLLVLSMHDEMHYGDRALRAGANGYVMKREARSRLIEAIRTVLRGEDYVSEAMQKDIVHRYIHGGTAQGARSPIKQLTDRELEVFDLLGRGLSTRQVAERLHLSQKTVDTHRTRIKEKLGVSGSADMIRLAFEWVNAQEPV